MRSQGGIERDNRNSIGTGGPWKAVQSIDHGEEATVGAPLLFGRLSTVLSQQVRDDLDVLIEAMASRPNRIVVRGHSSAEPFAANARWADPLELSYARAERVADYLIRHGVARERVLLSAVGSAEPRVISPDQSLNRRVEIFLADSFVPRQFGDQPTEASLEAPEEEDQQERVPR